MLPSFSPKGLAHSLRGPPSELEFALSGVLVYDDDADPSNVPVCPWVRSSRSLAIPQVLHASQAEA